MKNIQYIPGHEYAHAYIRAYNDGQLELVSYSTVVITVTPNRELVVHGLYSMTTRKHIGWFMRLLGLTYQDAKNAYENNQPLHV